MPCLEWSKWWTLPARTTLENLILFVRNSVALLNSPPNPLTSSFIGNVLIPQALKSASRSSRRSKINCFVIFTLSPAAILRDRMRVFPHKRASHMFQDTFSAHKTKEIGCWCVKFDLCYFVLLLFCACSQPPGPTSPWLCTPEGERGGGKRRKKWSRQHNTVCHSLTPPSPCC